MSEKMHEEKMPVGEEITEEDKSAEVSTDESSESKTEESAAAPAESEQKGKNKKKKEKKAKHGKKKKKLIKKIIIIAIIVILAVIVIFRLGERQIGWAKKVSDVLHLDKIPAISAIADFLPVDEICGAMNIGSEVQTAATETYQVYTASRRTIQKLLTGTGTLKPLDEYTVTALSSGEIIEDFFEEGDVVAEDQLLMRIDSSNLETSLERAQNSYDDALENLEDLRESREDLNVKSDYSGVIQVMNLEVGDEIRAGEVIASVVDRDTMLVDIPFMQADTLSINEGDAAVLTVGETFEELYGTVDEISPSYSINSNGVKTVNVTIAVKNPGVITESVSATAKIGEFACTAASNFYYNVNESIVAEASGEILRINKGEGDYISEGEIVLVLDGEDLDKSIEKAERNVRDAKNSLDDANEAFENYEITAPISGTVVEKNYKKGEKIGSSGGGSTVAVIYDLSALVFEMNIDELDIDSVSLGQSVKVTSDAKTGMSYNGEITKISVQGVTSNGTTYYPITVTISDYGQNSGNPLRSGMNIDAEIIIKEAANVIAIPVDAVGRGNRVTVVKNTEADNGAEEESDGGQTDGMQRPEGNVGERPERPDGMQRPAGADGEMPEGMTMPEGITMPEGMTLPEGMTMPEGMQR
ncbi:MAG: HlyD family efflux transporter periplasmic adaptor subunit, partial [Clostridia bacterium]|nr:HlyD family efflux transporter periplasmic adaptor subunit [Clostridia bacterium]